MSQGFMQWFLDEGDLPLTFVDNQSALALGKTTMCSKKSKHIALRFHVVREHTKDLCYCPTDLNLSDPLTKPLCAEKYLGMFLAGIDDNSDSRETVVDADFVHVFFSSAV